MDFTPTDEQELLRETARTLLAKECPPAVVRAHADDPAAADDLWRRHLSGWAVLGDGDLVDHALFLEECGAVVAPGPYFATSALFLPLVRTAAGVSGDAALGELADRAAAGEVTGTVAAAGADGDFATTADDADGVRTFVAEADRVDHVAVVLPGPALAVVPTAELGSVRPVATLDTSRRLFDLDVAADLAERAVAVPPDVLEAWRERVWVALAAELVGTARWLVEASVTYAKERVQFDRPVGSFQGLQWKLVGMSLDLERATAAVTYAAMAVDAGDPDRHRAVHVAAAAAGQAARHAARDGLQTHGGIGYTWEHDLHLYLRRAYASAAWLGTPGRHHDALAALVIDAG